MGSDFSWLVTGHFWLVTFKKHALFYVSEIIIYVKYKNKKTHLF